MLSDPSLEVRTEALLYLTAFDQFDPLVRRAEQLRFSRDGHPSVELHERLISLLAAGDAEQAASVAFDIWHSLPAEDGATD